MLGSNDSKALMRGGNIVSVSPKVTAEWNHNVYTPPRAFGSLSSTISRNFVRPIADSVTFANSYRSATTFTDGTNRLTPSFTATINGAAVSLLSFAANRSSAYRISFYVKVGDAVNSDSILLRFSEFTINNSTSTGTTAISSMTRRFTVDNINYEYYEMLYCPSDHRTTTVKVAVVPEYIETVNTVSSYTVLFSDFSIVPVDLNEYNTQNSHSVKSVFSGFRPGEEIASRGLDRNLTDVIYNNFKPKSVIYSYTATAASRTSLVSTLTIGSHNLVPGDYIVVGSLGNSFEGRYQITSVAATTVSYVNNASNVSLTAQSGTVLCYKEDVDSERSSVFPRIPQVSDGRVYIPGKDSISYYVDTMTNGSTTSPSYTSKQVSGLFAYYDKPLTTNKLVIKMLNSGSASMNTDYANVIVDYSVYTYSTSTNSWTEYSKVGTINKNGSLILYWNGSTWSSTESSATINESTMTLSGTTTIDGLAFVVKKIGYRSGGTLYELDSVNKATIYGLAKPNIMSNSVRFLEISPRLSVDLTTYLQSFSYSSETDSNDLPIPVGVATANNARVTFENIPRQYGASTIALFSDTTGTSPLKDLTRRDVKFTVKYDLKSDLSTTTESNIPFMTAYVDSWTIAEDSVDVELFDYAKYLQKRRVKDLMFIGGAFSGYDAGLDTIITELLQQNGFSDYNAFSMYNKDNNPTSWTIKPEAYLAHYYTDNQLTVWEALQEILLPYGLMAFFDAYGMLSITSIEKLSNNAQSAYDFYLTDQTVTDNTLTYISNILSFSRENKEQPSEIAIRYDVVAPSSSVTKGVNDLNELTFYSQSAYSKTVPWTSPQGSGLSYSKIGTGQSTLISPESTVIPLNISRWINQDEGWFSFSGYAAIGSEIISYDGMELSYVKPGAATPTFVVVKSREELSILLSSITAQELQNNTDYKLAVSYTGKLVNVERGLFGTKPSWYVTSSTPSDYSTAFPNAVVTTKASGAAPSTSNLFTQAISVKNESITDTRVISLAGQSSTKTTATTLYFNNSDSNDYDRYMFSFRFPENSTATSSVDDRVGIVLGYDNATGNAIRINIISETNTSGIKTAVYQNDTLIADSEFKIINTNQKTITAIVNKNKKLSKANQMKVPKKTYNALENVYVKIMPDGELVVSVNGSTIKWSKKPIVKTLSRNDRSVGMYVFGKNSINIHSISAWNSNNFIVSPEMSGIKLLKVIEGLAVSERSPFYFSSDPFVSEMKIFDIDYQSGPIFNQSVFRPVAQYEAAGSTGSPIIINIPVSATAASAIDSTPFKGKFAILNVISSWVPLNTSNTSPLLVAGNALVKSEEAVYKKKIETSSTSDNPIELSTEWVQSEENAKKVAGSIANGINLSLDTFTVECFGNPLIQVGDIVKLKYSIIGLSNDNARYVVIGADHTFEQGFSTTLTLRRIR